MRSRGARNDAVSMDLFPFMAVLICTVGALIMLLVVMVQQARVKAQEPDPAVAEQKQQIEAIQREQKSQLASHAQRKQAAEKRRFERDELKWKAELLRSSYDEAVGQIGDQRLRLSHLESHTRELSEQASAMQAEADLIAKTAKQASASDESVATKRQQLESAIESAQAELERKKEELQNVDPKYVLIPYAGPNGTNRRPIYIECRNDRVVLQPENVLLLEEDFLPPITAENPLARALRAKREFLQDNGLIGTDDEPYPLLVVRPGGAAAFAAARSAMTSWESEFGYELVESDVELDYLEADPRLKDLMEDVVLETRGRRRMMRSMQASRQPKPRERWRVSASGGFESVGAGEGLANQALGQRDGASSAEAYSGRGGSAGPYGDSNSANASTGQGGYASSGWSDGGQPSPFGSRNDGKADFGSSSDRDGSADYAQSGSGRQGDATSHRSPGSDLGAEGGWNSSSGFEQRASQDLAGAQPGTSLNTADQWSSQGQSPNPGSLTSDEDRNPFRGAGAGGTAENQGKGGSSAEATGAGGRGASGSGGSSSVANAQQASAAGSMSLGGSPASLASNRGSGWAMGGLQPEAVGIQRPIYVSCTADTISLLPERGTTQQLRTFQHRGSAVRVIDAFVESVQNRFESWGIAGQGIYWKPVLQVRVAPDAEGIYRHLRLLLDDSGIEVSRQP